MVEEGGALEKKEQELFVRSEISLVIRDYDEIFSDFDPRPYSHRSLSFDFMDEMRRAVREADTEGFELRILLPVSKMNSEKEAVIKSRLRDHIKKHSSMLEKEAWQRMKRGIFIALIGFLMMGFALYLRSSEKLGLFYDILYIFFEPGGWFTMWTGLDLIFAFASEKNRDLEFYKKMTKADIHFSHY